MTVETFYFCSDQALVKTWWDQPLEKTISDLAGLKIENKSLHWGLIDHDILTDIMIPKIKSITVDGRNVTSLSHICRATIEEAASPIKPGLLNLFPGRRKKIMEGRFGEIAQLADIHTGLVLASRRGPTNEPLETRVVDQYFSQWLEKAIPQVDAQSYDASMVKPSQYCYPPEFKLLNKDFIRDFEMYVPFAYLLEAGEWNERIGRINKLPGIWDSLLKDVDLFSQVLDKPNMKSYNRHTLIYNAIVRKYLATLNFLPPEKAKDELLMLGPIRPVSNEIVVTYLKKIAEISRYAIDHSLSLTKIMYM